MPHAKFNARSVGSLAPRAGRSQDYVWDRSEGSPPGFGVRLSAQSAAGDVARAYVLFYRIHGRQRFLKLGDVSGVSLADARDFAREALKEIGEGRDPSARKAHLRTAGTVAALVGQFVESAKTKRGREKSAATKRFYSQMLRAEIEGSDLGRASVATVTPEDVRARLDQIAGRAPVLANRVYQLVKAAFAWGILEGLVTADPCRTLREPRPEAEVPGDHVLSDAEIRLLWKALDAVDAEGARLLSPAAAGAVRVMLLAGTRRGETLQMRWQDVNLDLQRWSIPGEFRKGGEPLTVPLAPQAVKIIEGLEPPAKKRRPEFVFAGRDGASLLSNPGRLGAGIKAAVKAQVKAEAKETGKAPKVRPFTLHDLRRTCATGCGELGAPPHVVALILGHKTMPGWGNVTAVYDRTQRARDVAPWLVAWAAHVEAAVKGEIRKGADVLPMRTA